MSILAQVLEPVVMFIHNTVSHMGAYGIGLLMAIESCNIPLPSEAILPYAGFLVTQGVMSIHVAAFAGAIGCIVGSIPSYYIGYFGGRPFIEKYGKWFLISKHDLETADKWSKKYGTWAFFICRMLPCIRTFISLPAGILKVNLPLFLFLSFIGSLIWSYFLVWVGIKCGENLDAFKAIWHKFDALIIVSCVVLFGLYLYRHFKHLKED